MEISRALVVDDSRLARVALSKLLTRRGLDVDTADCGGEALDYLSQTFPDVVFIDYMMPDMDGFQAAEAIRRIPGGDALPMVMYTSQDSPEDRQRARELGIAGFLVKPTSDEGLDAVLAELRTARLRPVASGDETGQTAQTPEPAQPPAPAGADARHPTVTAGASAEPALSAQQARGIAEDVLRGLQAEAEQRWLQQLEQTDRRLEARLEEVKASVRETARETVQEDTESAERAASAAVSAAEQAARDAAEAKVRELLAEQPVPPAPEPDAAVVERVARAAAESVAREAVEQARAESAPGHHQDYATLSREALNEALQTLADEPLFREQVIAAVNEHAVPMLKNRLDEWVQERARDVALAAVDEAVERRLETVVREAVAASAESAASESSRLYRRWRLLWLGTTVVLAAGIALVLAIAV